MPQSTILTQELSLANNDFRNQRTRISKNSYVAKKSDKNARGCRVGHLISYGSPRK